MATYVTRGDSVRAVIRLGGRKPITKTFPTKAEAKIWALKIEADLIDKPRLGGGVTLGFVFEKARQRDLAKPYPCTGVALYARLTKEMGDMDLRNCDEEFWFDTVKGWDGICPYSRLTNLNRIRGALKYAQNAFKATVDWDAIDAAQGRLASPGVELIAEGEGRDRRVSAAEIAALKKAATGMDTIYPHADIIDFALATCMRAGEIFRATWDDLNTEDGHPMLRIKARKHPKKKMKNNQNIALLGPALAIINRQKKKEFWDGSTDNRIFPYPTNGYGNAFRRLKAAAKIKDLHFHDLRHEAISRLFEGGFGPAQVCLISGHTNWESLKIYTNLKSSSLHDGPFIPQQPQRRRAA